MIQSKLTGTDFYKLDVSTYNLTKILKNYAPKEWVRLNNELLSAKIENADKYQSPSYLVKDRDILKTMDSIGGIESGVDVSTLCGFSYSHILDQIISPVKNPKVSQTRVKLTVPKYIHLSVADINSISAGSNKQKYTAHYEYKLNLVQFPKWETFKMGTESLEQPGTVISQITYMPQGQHDRVYDKNMDKTSVFQNLTASVSLNIAKEHPDDIKIGSIIFNYPDYDTKYMSGLQNSIGNQAYGGSATEMTQYLQSGKKITVSISRTGSDDYEKDSVLEQYSYPNNGEQIDLTLPFEVTFPILHGHSMNNLKTDRVCGLKYHQIYTKIDPSKNYYVCVPRILSSQLFNPIPYLYKILQQSKWQMANNWSVINISNTVQGYEGFIVYTIAKSGIGMSKDVKFCINMAAENVNSIRIKKAQEKKEKTKTTSKK